MSDAIVAAIIGAIGTVLGAAVGGFFSLIIAWVFGPDPSRPVTPVTCAIIGLFTALSGVAGLVLGAFFGMSLIQPEYSSVQPSQSIPQVPQSIPQVPQSNDPQPNNNCPIIVIEGASGSAIEDSITWSELINSWSVTEPISNNLSLLCSRNPDGMVQLFLGWWEPDSRYLELQRKSSGESYMSVAEAQDLISRNPGEPVIVVPWK
ncbi:MAG: hypothetical protein KA314_24255 [Chloroflexi bacterium]|nr:hypothetical protein [Chloroflexota bacterium]MBP8058958.1 hypothetical protein [Chloroflexota bacterium]